MRDPDEQRVLDAAERLFYARGIQQVGMDDIRAEAGVSLKRLYQHFASKDQLVEAYLTRRDARWLGSLADHVQRRDRSEEAVLAVFDWLALWFAEQGFRGCAFTNSFGELGGRSPAVHAIARAHKNAFRGYLVALATAGHHPAELGEQLFLLAEGAITAAAVTGEVAAARRARSAAAALLAAAASG